MSTPTLVVKGRLWRTKRLLLLLLSLVLLLLKCGVVAHVQQQQRPPEFTDYNTTTFDLYPKDASSLRKNSTFVEEVSLSSPRIYLVHNAMTVEESSHVREMAQSKLRPSYVGTGGQGMKPCAKRRTSHSTFLLLGTVFETCLLKRIRNRLAHITQLSLSNFADLQVNHYNVGGKYEPHLDWAESQGVSEQAWTILLCLSTLEEDQGGETVFVRAKIKVRCVEGMAIVFRNMNDDDGGVDVESLHGGMPLKYGEKWNANQWVFTRPVPFARRVSLPLIMRPWGGDPPPFILRLRNTLIKRYGAAGGYRALNRLANAVLGTFGAFTFAGISVTTRYMIGKLFDKPSWEDKEERLLQSLLRKKKS